MSQEDILNALSRQKDKRFTSTELQEVTGLHRNLVLRALRQLRKFDVVNYEYLGGRHHYWHKG